ncbi:hypothetical protein DB345_05740 [Spartobacteria bacterium LR76]|nr:hypothetical protein DB345_05740 [Spartobacteria bacterium LR76]
MSDLEHQLAALPLADPPEALRTRVLARAAEQARQPRRGFFAWLWPHPVAWGAVAALWVVIAALNLSGPRGDALLASNHPVKSASAEELAQAANRLRERRVLLARWQQDYFYLDRSRL